MDQYLQTVPHVSQYVSSVVIWLGCLFIFSTFVMSEYWASKKEKKED